MSQPSQRAIGVMDGIWEPEEGNRAMLIERIQAALDAERAEALREAAGLCEASKLETP